MKNKETDAERRKGRIVTAVVVAILGVIFVVGFIWGLDLVLALEGSYPPNDLTEGAVPPPETAAEAAKLLTDAVENALKEQPKIGAHHSFYVVRDGENGGIEAPGSDALRTYLGLVADTVGNSSQPLGKLLSEAYPDRGAGYGEDTAAILPEVSFPADAVEGFKCEYIYYVCPVCELESQTPADSCEECGGTRPYVMKYRDAYTVTLTLKADTADRLFIKKNAEEIADLFIGTGSFRVSGVSTETKTVTVVYKLDRLSLELRSLILERTIAADAILSFFAEYESLGRQPVSLTLGEKEEYTLTWPSLTLNRNVLSIEPGSTDNLLATVVCADPLAAEVTWESSDESVVTVDEEGYLKAGKEPGTAEVTARFTFRGKEYSDTCRIEVKVSVESLSLSSRKLKLKTGEEKTLTAKPSPSDATVKSVTWYTENPDIAKVDENGAVTGVAPGKTTVYALSDDGWFRASCEVTVNE